MNAGLPTMGYGGFNPPAGDVEAESPLSNQAQTV